MRPPKESPRERHDRMISEIDAFLADIDAVLADSDGSISVIA